MTSTFKNILVPYNGTESSQKAFDKAIALASNFHAKITLFTCIEKRPTFSLFKSKTKNDEFERERKIIEKQHIEMKKFAKEKNVDCNSKIVSGDYASEEILSFVDQHNIDLIIMQKTKFPRIRKEYTFKALWKMCLEISPVPF